MPRIKVRAVEQNECTFRRFAAERRRLVRLDGFGLRTSWVVHGPFVIELGVVIPLNGDLLAPAVLDRGGDRLGKGGCDQAADQQHGGESVATMDHGWTTSFSVDGVGSSCAALSSGAT